MANYPLSNSKRIGAFLSPQNSYYSDEYCEQHVNLYLHTELHKNEEGKYQNYYRLHAYAPHTIEMALAYDIQCPKCTGMLKKVTRCNSQHDLGLYTCPMCNKNR